MTEHAKEKITDLIRAMSDEEIEVVRDVLVERGAIKKVKKKTSEMEENIDE